METSDGVRIGGKRIDYSQKQKMWSISFENRWMTFLRSKSQWRNVFEINPLHQHKPLSEKCFLLGFFQSKAGETIRLFTYCSLPFSCSKSFMDIFIVSRSPPASLPNSQRSAVVASDVEDWWLLWRHGGPRGPRSQPSAALRSLLPSAVILCLVFHLFAALCG